MKAFRVSFSLAAALAIPIWLLFLGSTFIGSAQTPTSGLTVENFFQAVHGNDTNTVFRMLEADSNLVHAVYYGRLPLTVAAGDGSVQIVEQLLKRGADVNVQNDTWNTSNVRLTALEAAIWSGNTNLCKLLLEAGANPDLQSGFEGSALHYAFAYRRTEVAGWLLDYGADPFLPKAGYGGATPVELAIKQGDGKLVPRMLGQEGAGPAALKPAHPLPWKKTPAESRKAAANIITERGTQLLSAAAQRAELEAVEALLKEGVSAKTNVPGGMPVLQSVAIAEAPAIKAYPDALAQWQQTSNELKRLGTNANQWNLDFTRSRATEQAARVDATNPERWLKIRDLLIKNGADYDAFAATAMGDIQQTTKLLATDRSVVQARDRDGQTPLHWAVQNDQLPLTSFWLQAGASPAATNLAGQTPLHIAATKGLSEQVKVLLAASAPTDIRDTNGWTPLDAAIQAKQSDCIHLLMAKAPAAAHSERGPATPLHEAAASGNVAALASLLETETNLEARNELGLTPLQVAGQAGQLGAAAVLIDHGADVNARDPDGNTVLHQILLSRTHWVKGRPSDAWVVERRKKNPSQEKFWRVYNTPSGYTSPRELAASVAFFLACGADTAATNHAGQTILQLVTADSTMLWDYDRAAILPLLQQSGNGLNERDADGNTALHRLCTGFYDVNKVENMASLIASGADINATNNLGQTPLHLAAEKIGLWDNNDPPVNAPFQLLIYSKANVNAQDNQGLTPLDVLALSDSSFRTEATRALLDAKANPNLRDKQGRTPAHLFLSGKWPWGQAGECIDMLVAAGADLSAKDDQGKTPLHYLAQLGSQNPMFFIRGIGDTFVLAKVDINTRDSDGDTPLQLAAKTGTKDVYDWLVKQGASQDVTNNAGETPRQQALRSTNVFSDFRFNPDTDIFQAIREGKQDSVAAILKSIPDLLNQTNQFGQTPLLLAAQMRRTNIVDFLDAHGVRWDPVSAIHTGRTEVLRKLITEQPQLAADGSSLRLAAANGNVPAVAILLAAGADLKATDPDGLSPLGIALVQHHGDVAELLTKQGATKNIFDAVFSDDTETAAALIERDKSLVPATNAIGVSLAEIAAACGNEKTLKLLLDKGVSPGYQNPSTGRSLIHAAATYDQTNTAQMLVQRHAKLDVADNSGFAPLHVCALRGSVDVLDLLLKHKVNSNQGTIAANSIPPFGGIGPQARQLAAGGNTALHLAAMTGQTNVIVALLKWGASVNATNSYGMTPLDMASMVGPPPFLLMRSTDMRLPIGPPVSSRENPMQRRAATIALLEQAGGKHGERRGPAGMPPFGPPTMTRFPAMGAVPAPQAPALQTGDDYRAQGCVDYNARRYTNALADFRKSCELGSNNQDYSYFRIWLIRARLGEKEAAIRELAAYLENRKTGKPDDWPSKVGKFLAGQLSESDFLKAADDPSLQTSKEQHCEAYFYVGSKHLIDNDKMAAVDFFKKCLTTNVTNFEEYISAASELLFLQLPPTH